MKEGPILFSGEMVRATLEGRKTKTRRVIKPEWYRCLDLEDPEDVAKALAQCPYGQNGDRLWVREMWRPVSAAWESARPEMTLYTVEYKVGDQYNHHQYVRGPANAVRMNRKGWRPSIHMPRWASRITLEVVGVGVERLHKIRYADCIAEGITDQMAYDAVMVNKKREWPDAHAAAYADLWDQLNAKRGYGWDVNPWVWVIEFKRMQP